MADTTTNPIYVQFSEQQIQNLVTMVLQSVNTRIAERIVQSATAGDTKHVVSADAVKKAIDDVQAVANAAIQSNTDKIGELTDKVGDGTEAAKSYTDTQIATLREAMMGMNHWDIVAVTGELPTDPAANTIYLQRDDENDLTWEMNIVAVAEDGTKSWITIGDTSIDLANYWPKDSMDEMVTAMFTNETFTTKLAEFSASLDLDSYWKKDDITALTAAVVAEVNPAVIYKVGNISSLKALLTDLNIFYANPSADPSYGVVDTLATIYSKSGVILLNNLREAANITPQDFNALASVNEKIVAAIKAIAATTDLADTYLAIAALKEYLGIEGELTTESMEQAILRIVNENEVETIPLTDEKLNELVTAAFNGTNPDLGPSVTPDPDPEGPGGHNCDTDGHIWDEGAVTKQPSCEGTGTKTFTCSVCGATREEVIPANGHTASSEPVGLIPATHTTSGYSGDIVCETCGTIITEGIEIQAMGHQFGNWTKENDTSHVRVCSSGADCGIERENHTWDSGRVTREPTETLEGVMTYTCSKCNGTKDMAIPKLIDKEIAVYTIPHMVDAFVKDANRFVATSSGGWSYGIILEPQAVGSLKFDIYKAEHGYDDEISVSDTPYWSYEGGEIRITNTDLCTIFGSNDRNVLPGNATYALKIRASDPNNASDYVDLMVVINCGS